MRRLRRSARMIAGLLLMLVGVAVTPTPLPIGLILILAGLTLLVAESAWLREMVRLLRRRLPGVSRRMTAIRARLPGPVARVIDLTDPALCEREARCAEAAE